MTAATPSPPVALAHDVEAERTMARHGVTFRLATRLLPPDAAAAIFDLYAFCREVDDLVDERRAADAGPTLDRLAHEIVSGHSARPWVQRLLDHLADADALAREALVRLLVAMRADLEPVRYETLDDLLRYCYGAAGTVGLVYCALAGVDDPDAHPFAIDLGIGMQLTNIARDVLEDARAGRRYLPAELLEGCPSPLALEGRASVDREDVSEAVLGLLQLAHRYYRSADQGLTYLPGRARLAALFAARMYEGIGQRLARDGARWWRGRTILSTSAKLGLCLRTIALEPGMVLHGGGTRPAHDASLHRSLRGLPGVDPRA